MLFHRQEKRETRATRRRDDEATTRLVALAVRVDVAALAQVLVHEAPLRRRHRPQRHLAALADGALGGAIGLRAQRLLAPSAVTGGVDA